jgi:hypothetical protein
MNICLRVKPLVIRALLVSVLGFLTFSGTASAKDVSLDLKIGDGSGWSFLGGPWTENAKGSRPLPPKLMHSHAFFEEGVIMPPDKGNLHSRAFYKAQGFGDLTAEFGYNANYRENGSGIAGLILRAVDANHFYLVYFPWSPQQLSAKHFWAAIARVEGDGYLRNLKMVWVPGIPSETDRWYQVRVEAKGPQISVWVDGRNALSVTDSTYKSGCVGLAGYGMYYFRNVHVKGTAVSPTDWNDKTQIPTHAFTVGLNSAGMTTGCVALAPSGDVLLFGKKLEDGTAALARSKNKGRTWSLEKLTNKIHNEIIHLTRDGRLIFHRYHHQPGVFMSESKDNGKSWSETVSAKMPNNWPIEKERFDAYGSLVETEDGTLIRFLMSEIKWEGSKFDSVVGTWGSYHFKAYAIRSIDGGKSWSAPIEIDRPTFWGKARGSIPGALDFTETTGVAIGNRVTAVIRPLYSQTMWQCWSDDAGATWDSAVRTTFPGYAQSMLRLKSGAILVAHRYPQYSVNVSRDNGLNWDEGTVIDYPSWAMGCMVEVEPDVVLVTYMNSGSGGQESLAKEPLLVQLIRVTKEGIYPISP